MSRPRFTWIAFLLCLAVVSAAMGWVTHVTLDLERAEAQAARQSENERLALWRMESALVALIAQESARPHYAFLAFHRPEHAYSKMLAPIVPGEVQVPSELLAYESPFIVLHFQYGPQGEATSPQVPTSNLRDLAEANYTTPDRINRYGERLELFCAACSPSTLASALDSERTTAAVSEPLTVPVRPDHSQAPLPGNESDAAAANAPADLPAQTDPPSKGVYEENVLTQQFITRNQMQQTARSLNEYQRRSMTAEQNSAYGVNGTNGIIIDKADSVAAVEQVEQGVMQAVWIDEALILARRTVIDDQPYLQGCVLEWRAIADALTAEVRDLLPQALLLPARDAAAAAPLRLASLPLMLDPGRAPQTPIPLVTPLRLSLLLAWVGLAIAALAVAALLMAAMRLSDRRGDFVSAVTHELRTPLTTFRMYTEMLAEGMVQDEHKRAGYLQTLRVEADRLGHLVENVLSYARLERNSVRAEQEEIPLDDLLARVEDSLRQRAERAGMSLCIERPDESIVLRADRAAVERILFNLIDNACKYAADAEDRRIHLAVSRDGRRACFRVRDHGRGISRPEARRLFRPFSKSAQQAAHSAPGVGLGLALCRRLARSMHGDLRIDHAVTDGACFALTLPTA